MAHHQWITQPLRRMPGVVQIFTGADFEGVGSSLAAGRVTDKHGEVDAGTRAIRCWPGQGAPCGRTDCRVVAETLEQARDAAEAIESTSTSCPPS